MIRYRGVTMEGVLLIAALLACPISMGLMMWFMSKSGGTSRASGPAGAAELRAEHARLRPAFDRRVRAQAGAAMERSAS
jgi:hypothetical protein